MTTRYTEKQIKDVAFILSCHTTAAGMDNEEERMEWLTWMAKSFADLFAADNPPNSRCWNCGDDKSTTSICTRPNEGHNYGGFDPKQFLADCGLEHTCPLCVKSSLDLVVIDEVHPECADKEQAYSDYVAGKMAGELDK